MPKRAIVILAQGFEEIEAVAVIDVLRRAGVGLTVASLVGREVEGAHGLVLQANTTIGEVIEAPDALILPGGLPGSANLGASDTARRLAREVCGKGGICAAICAAPALALARWGLLEGRRATCYPSFETEFPASAVFSEDPVVVDGNIVTSRGPGTALDFALTLAGLLTDPGTSDKLRQGMLVP